MLTGTEILSNRVLLISNQGDEMGFSYRDILSSVKGNKAFVTGSIGLRTGNTREKGQVLFPTRRIVSSIDCVCVNAIKVS